MTAQPADETNDQGTNDQDAALALYEAIRAGQDGTAAIGTPAGADGDEPPAGEWPGIDDPGAFRTQLADWLTQYANANTRRTYALALGLPLSWVDTLTAGAPAPVDAAAAPQRTSPRRPPPAPRGPLHHLAWFRWCAARSLDPPGPRRAAR